MQRNSSYNFLRDGRLAQTSRFSKGLPTVNLRAKFIIIGIYRGSYEIRFVIHEQAPFIKEKEIKHCTKATFHSAPEPCV
jgi:hypothetical protein